MILLLSWLLACGAREARVEAKLDDMNYCEEAADCVDVGGECPFGCYVLVNEAEASAARALLDRHVGTCVYDCAAPTEILCEAGRCTMEGW
jgi:hypothetical protein